MRRTLPSRRIETLVWIAATVVFFALYAGSWWLVLALESA